MDGIEPCIAHAVGGEPASRRPALAVLLVVPILRHHELGLQRHPRLWPGATRVAAITVWKYSMVPPLRLRVE
jgi:hypothetical protein